MEAISKEKKFQIGFPVKKEDKSKTALKAKGMNAKLLVQWLMELLVYAKSYTLA